MLDNDIPLDWIDEQYSVIYTSENIYSISLNGKILCFSVSVKRFSNKAEIVSYSGFLDGKISQNSTFVTNGKNVGKLNETDISQQAILEAKSIFQKKIKEGYKTLFSINERMLDSGYHFTKLADYAKLRFNTDHNNRLQPMLAKSININKLPRIILWQRKYNGVRCRVHIENDTIKLISREGEEFTVVHIIEELSYYFNDIKNLIGKEGFLDGELYVHGLPLQDIVSLVKTPSNESFQLKYIIYDIGIKYDNNLKRYKKLKYFFDDEKLYCQLAETVILNSETQPVKEEIFTLSKTAHNDGYEGGMIRDASAEYYFGFRPTGILQKIKFDKSADFVIVGHTIPDSGILVDFVFTCVTPNGHTFEVKPHGKEEKRLKIINNIDKYIGEKLQLSFYEYTKDKIPFHITSVTIRNYE